MLINSLLYFICSIGANQKGALLGWMNWSFYLRNYSSLMVYQLTPYCDVQKILLLVVGTKLNIISQLVSEYDLYLCQITL